MMTDAARRSIRPLGWLVLVSLALVPLAILLALIPEYAVNVPLHDEWEWSVRHFLDEDLAHGRLDQFWVLQNEHRLFMPSLITAVLAEMTNLNMVAGVYLKVFLTLLILLGLWRLFLRTAIDTRQALWILVPFSFLVFSLAQWPRWIDVRPIPSTLSLVGLVGSLICMTTGERSRGRFIGGVVFAVVSSLSYFSGNITWVAVGAAMVFAGWSRGYLIAWGVAALAVLIPYAIDFAGSTSTARTDAPAGLFELVKFLIAFIGAVMSDAHWSDEVQLVAIVFGVLGIVGASLLALWTIRDLDGGLRKALPWIAICAWVLANGAAAAYGRAALEGVRGACVYRYTVFSTQFWVAIAALTFLALFDPSRSRRLRIVGFAMLAVFAVGSVLGFRGGVVTDDMGGFTHMLRHARAHLLLEGETRRQGLEFLHPELDRIERRIPELIERKAEFMYGEYRLELKEAVRPEASVTSYPVHAGGRMTQVFESVAPLELNWRVRILDHPSADFRVRLPRGLRGPGVSLTVKVRDGESTHELTAVEQGGLRLFDLRAFRGREIELTCRIAMDAALEPERRILLITPAVVYSLREREPK